MSNTVQKKKKHQFPTAYTVIIIVLLLVQILTFFIPSGNYATLEYDQPNKEFVITKPMVVNIKRQQLKKLWISIKLRLT